MSAMASHFRLIPRSVVVITGLYAVAATWLIWLLFWDVLSWDYFPIPKKLATTVVGLLIPAIFLLRRTKTTVIVALVLAGLTWYPILWRWMHDRAPFGI